MQNPSVLRAGWAALLLAAGLMTGCDRGATPAAADPAPAPSAAAAKTTADREQVLGARWSQMFADPGAVIAAANELGYDAAPWRSDAADRGFGAEATQQIARGPNSTVRIDTRFAASGAAHQVESIRFRFEVAISAAPKTKADRDGVKIPRKLVTGFLGRINLSPNEEVRDALMNATSVTTRQHGGRIVVDSQGSPTIGSRYVMTVTITPN